jgi:hypothetical protein
MNVINKNAKLLTKAVEAGMDPFTVELHDAPQSGTPRGRGNKWLRYSMISFAYCTEHDFFTFLRSLVDFYLDIAPRFGGDCTASALENRFRRIKKDAKLINDSIVEGIDPITLAIGDTDGEAAIRGVKRGPGQIKNFLNHQALCLFSFYLRTLQHLLVRRSFC